MAQTDDAEGVLYTRFEMRLFQRLLSFERDVQNTGLSDSSFYVINIDTKVQQTIAYHNHVISSGI